MCRDPAHVSLKRDQVHVVMYLILSILYMLQAAEGGHLNVHFKHQEQVICWFLHRVTRFIPAKILYPVMNIHNVQVMLSAHRLCIFSSNLQRQLNETLPKADKSRRHVRLIKHNKSRGEGCDHVRDYFRCFTRLARNKLGPLSDAQVYDSGL